MDKKTKRWINAMTMWGCHQRPERSFFLYGYQFPLCSRCTGILIGYLCSVLLMVFGWISDFLTCSLLILPLILDGGIQLLFDILSNNRRRFITGILFGIGFAQLFVHIIKLLSIYLMMR